MSTRRSPYLYLQSMVVLLVALIPVAYAAESLWSAGTAMPLLSIIAVVAAAAASASLGWYVLRSGQQRLFLLAAVMALSVGGVLVLFGVRYPWLVSLLWLPGLLGLLLIPLLLRGASMLALSLVATLVCALCAQWAWVEVRSMQADYDAWEAAERERLQAVQRYEDLTQRRQRELGYDDDPVGGGAVYAEQTREELLDIAGMGAVEGEAVEEIVRQGRRAQAAAGDPFAYRRQKDEDGEERAAPARQITVEELRRSRRITQGSHIMSEILLVFVVLVAMSAYAHGMTRLRPRVPVLPIGHRWLDQAQPGPGLVALVGGSESAVQGFLGELWTAAAARREPLLYCGAAADQLPQPRGRGMLGWPRALPLRRDKDEEFLADSQVCFHALWFARASYAVADPELAERLLSDLAQLWADCQHTRAQAGRRITVIWDFPEQPLSPLFVRRLAHLLAVTHGRLVIVCGDTPDPRWRGLCDEVVHLDRAKA